MAKIIIKTQADMDALPDRFEEHTAIEIHSTSETIFVKKARENSSVVARGNSSVVAWDNSSVIAYGNSSVVARDRSTVEARDRSTVEAWHNSSVEARGNSTVEAWGNSSVRAHDNSSVRAWDNSSVEAWHNSSVDACGNSSVRAWDNSSVEAWHNSSVELFLFSYAMILGSRVIVKRVLDFSTVVFRGCPARVEEKAETAHVREVPRAAFVPFEEWIRRGYIVADGITKKLKSRKTIGDVDVFECEDFPAKTTSYVVKRGETFSHGETVKQAIEDLRYKVSDRDTSRFESWRNDMDKEVSLDDAIAAYRTVTGACAMGTKEFVESTQVPEKLTPRVILELTDGRFGNDRFREFLGG